MNPSKRSDGEDHLEGHRSWRPLNAYRITLALAVLAALVTHLNLASTGWYHTLSVAHNFRQTQTAIAAYYMLQDGLELDYRVPVLGPNWRLPHEFPAYQWTVVAVVKLTGMGLEQAGRLVSLASFYACALLVVLLLRNLGFGRAVAGYALLLLLSTATYIFYSRTFLIESFALMLTLAYVALACGCLFHGGARWKYVLLFPAGMLAAVGKVTTFSTGMGLLLLIMAAWLVMHRETIGDKAACRRMLVPACSILLAVIAALLWNRFIMHSWSASPQYADARNSIHMWSFGAWKLRSSQEFWSSVFRYGIHLPFGSIVLPLLAFACHTVAPRKHRYLGLGFFAAWCAGFLVWSNLFQVHDYYYYATAAYLVIWAAIALHGLATRFPVLRWPVLAFVLLFTSGQFYRYTKSHYYEGQIYDWEVAKVIFAREVGDQTPESGVLMILGEDWNPMIAYYAGRYANMVRWPQDWCSAPYLSSVHMMEAEGRYFSGIVLFNQAEIMDELAPLVTYFGFNLAEPRYSDCGQWIFYQILDPGPVTPRLETHASP
jgi:hypothetical protein